MIVFLTKGMKRFILYVWLVLSCHVFAQRPSEQDSQLALQYFDQREYDKANVYFDNLFDKNPDRWFTYYYKSLMAVKAYDKAEKISKRQIKNRKEEVSFYVYLGKAYKAQEDLKKEKEAYDKALKELDPQQYLVQSLAIAFIEESLFDYALDAYRKGRKATPDYPYHYEVAEVYKKKGDLTAMINEYLDAIAFRETELGNVQMALQNNLGYDDEEGGIKNPLLKQELQKRIQKNPDKIVLTEFLIFIQKQQRDFDGAFVQSKALDKRLKEEGTRVFELGQMCQRNERWETAQRCFQYILDKGINNMYYDAASIDILDVEYNLITQQPKPDLTAMQALEVKYQKLADKYKGSALYAMVIKSQANLQAFYLNKPLVAIDNLNGLIAMPGMDNVSRATYKLLLADIYLLSGSIWDASLLYSQVEKDFKYEPIGQEAKFKNAKLSFYAGDFKWAKTQADVLKGATTKLIANDALDLSLIITDAIGIDTNDLPLKLFSSADLMVVQHRYTEAINRMDSVNKLFPENTLGDDIYFKKAQIYTQQGAFKDAEQQYKNIVEFYPSDLYGDDAQFKLAELYEIKLGDVEKARQAYQEVLIKYPGSIYVVEARKRYRQLRGDVINN